ncbi:hypothetical protein SAMN05421858_5101 [Haladaptatus litoreus]|uniref:Uncharacterized protein n=1 Tax=Haladaptatus litoreus TaxID=553468 RepID=A0A1N7FIB9_9EURY|nr:hypothetical protein [Haladaptatus litoreus]SIS00168.1 hypothetical protein SAMN05421858_5101 [Haladaptatus litoreus]
MSTDKEEYWGCDASEKELDAVWSVLKDHVGEENAITSGEISDILGGMDELDSTPQTRKCVRALIHKRNIPIGSGHNGYWVMESEDELEDTIAQLTRRKQGITARQEKLVEGFAYWQEGDA